MDTEQLNRIRRDLYACTNGQHWQVEHARALLAEVDRLRIKVERLTVERDESDRYRAGRLVRERDEWEANAQEAMDEVERLRAAIGYALPTIGCGATYDKLTELLGYPEEDELDEYEARFLALTDG